MQLVTSFPAGRWSRYPLQVRHRAAAHHPQRAFRSYRGCKPRFTAAMGHCRLLPPFQLLSSRRIYTSYYVFSMKINLLSTHCSPVSHLIKVKDTWRIGEGYVNLTYKSIGYGRHFLPFCRRYRKVQAYKHISWQFSMVYWHPRPTKEVLSSSRLRKMLL